MTGSIPSEIKVQPTPALGIIVFAFFTALFGLSWFWVGWDLLPGHQFPFLSRLPLNDSLVLACMAFAFSAICIATATGLARKALWAYRIILWLAASCTFGGICVASIITFFLIDSKNVLGWPAVFLGVATGLASICFPLCYLAYFFRERISQRFGSL